MNMYIYKNVMYSIGVVLNLKMLCLHRVNQALVHLKFYIAYYK